MEKLLDKINEIPQNQWDYYFGHSNREFNKPRFDKKNHAEFIKAYFKRSGKGNIFKNYFEIKNSLLLRSTHTVSIFFLGILIFFNTKIRKSMNWGGNQPEYDIFPFIWFLTCLFHDFGYDYEIGTKKYLSKIWDIDSLKKLLKIKYNLLDKNINYIPDDLYQSIRKYFLYKRVMRKEIDHGIVAGIYLYDKLVKNRHYKKRKAKNDDDLYWGKHLDSEYALAGATIAIHNIWLPDNKSIKFYKQFELDCLINRAPISLNEAPLLFLLGLVDTIDPIKLYDENNTEVEIMNGILIECFESEIRLSVSVDSKLNFNDLKNRCNTLKPWLQVQVLSNDSQVCIKL